MDLKILIPLAAYVLWNIITFCVAAYDKRAATHNPKKRIRERTFCIHAILGGGLGILFAFYGLRHKTKHPGVLASVWIPFIIELVAVIALYFLFVR